MTRPLRLHAFTWLAAAGCSSSDRIDRAVPAVDAEQPLSAETLRSAFAPPWKAGTTWMVKERCAPGTPRARNDLTGLLEPWPAYVHFEVVSASAEAFVLARTTLPEAPSAPNDAELRRELSLFRRFPFGLADGRPRQSADADLGTVVEPWSLGPCIGSNRRETRCPPTPAAPPDHERDAAKWPVRQVALPIAYGTRFLYWENGLGPSSLEWRTSEPYWEDSLGCSRLVRDLDGHVHEPHDIRDLGDAEPRIMRVQDEPPMTRSSPSPAGARPGPSLLDPGWRVGDTWVTRHHCPSAPRSYERHGAWFFAWPPPPVPEAPLFAFYEVLEETSEEFIVLEQKAARSNARPRRLTDGASSSYEGGALWHFFRKRPFGLVRWQTNGLSAQYDGGPCLNVGRAVDRCPFPMPAEPPAEGAPPSWIAEQTARRSVDALELEYLGRDGSQLTIRWRNGDPWPEASPSCTTLLRNPDGTVLRPGDVDAFLKQWEVSPEFEEVMRAAKEQRPSKLRDP
jgi:hypothetical protein